MNLVKVAEIRKRLYESGHRTTIARLTLLYILENSMTPMTLVELYEEAQPTINNRSTISRVLRDLEDLGFCLRIQTNGESRYAALKP